jgi:hypothetical protein
VPAHGRDQQHGGGAQQHDHDPHVAERDAAENLPAPKFTLNLPRARDFLKIAVNRVNRTKSPIYVWVDEG